MNGRFKKIVADRRHVLKLIDSIYGITEVLSEREILLDDIIEIMDEAFEVIIAEKYERLEKDIFPTEAGEKIRT